MRLCVTLVFVAPGAAAVSVAIISMDLGHAQPEVEQKVLDHPTLIRQRAADLHGCKLDNPQIVEPSNATPGVLREFDRVACIDAKRLHHGIKNGTMRT